MQVFPTVALQGQIINLEDDKKRLRDALEQVLDETGTECYCSENYSCGRCAARSVLFDLREREAAQAIEAAQCPRTK